MALISCPECSKQVSSAAPQCPNCGYPLSQPAEHPTHEPPAQSPPASTYAQATQTTANTPQQATHIVIHQPIKNHKGLARAAWILIFLVCGVALLPFLGFASWLVAGPVFFVTFILSIMVLSRGGTLSGILLLFTSIIGGPVFVTFAPFISSFLGLTRVGAAAINGTSDKAPLSTPVSPDAESAFALGNDWYYKHDNTRAQLCFERAVQISTASGRPHDGALNNLGVIALSEKRLKNAEVFFQLSLRTEPNAPKTWFLLAEACRDQGDIAHAEVAIAQAIKLNGNEGAFQKFRDELRKPVPPPAPSTASDFTIRPSATGTMHIRTEQIRTVDLRAKDKDKAGK